jgi:RNA polymerase sigma factor for flagellar operon FliA
MNHDKNLSVPRAYQGHIAERVQRFVPMVRRLAWHVHGSGRQGIELEDLMQAGMVALTECAQRHTGPGEDGFAAYAKMRVRGAMVDLIRRHIPLARSAARHEAQIRFESIDEAYSDSDLAFADDRPDSFALLADEELRGAVAGAIAGLPQRLQLVVQLYFVEELNLAEIAETLSVSVPRVHQLKAQALDALRKGLDGVAELL